MIIRDHVYGVRMWTRRWHDNRAEGRLPPGVRMRPVRDVDDDPARKQQQSVETHAMGTPPGDNDNGVDGGSGGAAAASPPAATTAGPAAGAAEGPAHGPGSRESWEQF